MKDFVLAETDRTGPLSGSQLRRRAPMLARKWEARMTYRTILLVVIANASLAACSQESEQPRAAATPAQVADAATVAQALKQAGLPVTGVVAVTADTDRDHLLGKPGSYTSKVMFRDARHPGTGLDTENVIELFATVPEAMRRGEQLTQNADAATRDMIQGRAYLRLAPAILPAEADAYRKAMLDGKIGS